MKHLKHKIKSLVAALVFVCLLATGYAGQVLPVAFQSNTNQNESGKSISSNTADEKSHSHVNWMGHWLYEDLRETLVREVAKEFEFENYDIRLNLKFPQEIMGVRSKPLTATYVANMIRSNTIKWDVIWLDDNIYTLVAEELNDTEWGKKYLVDFESIPGFTETQKRFIIENPIYRNQTGGMMVGPYIEGYLYALWYNKNVAQRLGLIIKNRDMTLNDLIGYAQVVHEYNTHSGTPISLFYEAKDWPTLEMLFQRLFKSTFENYDEAISQVSSARKQAALLKAFQAFEQLGQYHPLIPSHHQNIWFDTRQLVLDDKALFYVGGTWMYSHWRGIDQNKLEKMVPAELPVFQKVNHSLGGYIPSWAVMKNSPNREAAISLVMYWSRSQVAEKWVRYTKNPTGLRGNLDSAVLGSDLYEKFQFDIIEKYGSDLDYCADAAYIFGHKNAHLGTRIDQLLRMLLTEKITAQQAYKDIVEQLE